MTIFCALGFLASAGLLHALWRRYFAEVSLGVVVACVLALGLATGVPVLLPQSEVYEVPITCGYMLTMLALGAIWCAAHEPERRGRWLAMASVAYGLAVGARPNLLFGAVILLVPVAQAWRERRAIGALLAAAMGPITLIGLGLMLYNFLRFENPFEFGVRYELGPARMQLDKLRWFSLSYVWFNLRVYFLEPAHWSTQFPFVHPIVVPPLPMGRGQVETPYGVLSNVPLVWLALAVPLAWRGWSTEPRSILGQFLASVALVFGINTFVLCLFRGANFRYQLEFLPALVLLAVVGLLGLERGLAPNIRSSGLVGRPVWRRAARWGWALLLGFSVAFNLLVCVVKYAEARCYRGNALLRAGMTQEAMEQYRLALRIDPDLALAHNLLGTVLCQTGKVQEGIGHFELALRIKPGYAVAHYNLGTSLAQVGKIEDAIGHYEQALQLEPDYADAHDNLGFALEQLGRVKEAIREYEQVVRIIPNDAQALDELARLRAGGK